MASNLFPFHGVAALGSGERHSTTCGDYTHTPMFVTSAVASNTTPNILILHYTPSPFQTLYRLEVQSIALVVSSAFDRVCASGFANAEERVRALLRLMEPVSILLATGNGTYIHLFCKFC